MKLLFRLLYIRLFARFRSPVQITQECVTPFRTLPTDLDVLRHMNNGVYFTLQDLARIDLMIRSGLYQILTNNGWRPVVTAETLRFRKSLKLFQAFNIHTQVLYWDEKYFYLQHTFVRNNEMIAKGIIKGLFLKKTGGMVQPQEMMQALGLTIESPAAPDFLKLWDEATLLQSLAGEKHE